jgi:hypothetical protein
MHQSTFNNNQQFLLAVSESNQLSPKSLYFVYRFSASFCPYSIADFFLPKMAAMAFSSLNTLCVRSQDILFLGMNKQPQARAQ